MSSGSGEELLGSDGCQMERHRSPALFSQRPSAASVSGARAMLRSVLRRPRPSVLAAAVALLAVSALTFAAVTRGSEAPRQPPEVRQRHQDGEVVDRAWLDSSVGLSSEGATTASALVAGSSEYNPEVQYQTSSGPSTLQGAEDNLESTRVSTIVHQPMSVDATIRKSTDVAAETTHSSTIVHEAPKLGTDGKAVPRDPRVEHQSQEAHPVDKSSSKHEVDGTGGAPPALQWGSDHPGDGQHQVSSSAAHKAQSTCHDADVGDSCYENVTWAKTRGIWDHPEWYPGLNHSSSRADFQQHLFETAAPGSCQKPCPGSKAGKGHDDVEDKAWNQACYFDFNGGASTKCFCQLAGNRGCQNEPCVCPQGCFGVTWDHSKSVTFRNKAKAYGCDEPTALLTIPKSYFSQIRFLKTWCPSGMKALLEEMLREGFNSYTEFVGPAPVQQCIHAATSVSTAWLHLHTFCGAGHVDGMPAAPAVSWCSLMMKPEEAAELAEKVLAWAVGLYGALADSQPSNCATMGCGAYGPAHRCSCNDKCTQYGDCCSDYRERCSAL